MIFFLFVFPQRVGGALKIFKAVKGLIALETSFNKNKNKDAYIGVK